MVYKYDVLRGQQNQLFQCAVSARTLWLLSGSAHDLGTHNSGTSFEHASSHLYWPWLLTLVIYEHDQFTFIFQDTWKITMKTKHGIAIFYPSFLAGTLLYSKALARTPEAIAHMGLKGVKKFLKEHIPDKQLDKLNYSTELRVPGYAYRIDIDDLHPTLRSFLYQSERQHILFHQRDPNHGREIEALIGRKIRKYRWGKPRVEYLVVWGMVQHIINGTLNQTLRMQKNW